MQTKVPSPSRPQQPVTQGGLQPVGAWQTPLRQAPPPEQATQAATPVPQALEVGGLTQTPPWQQPLGQVSALQPWHWPLRQVVPLGQETHETPLIPQAPFDVPGWQAAPAQQPAQRPGPQVDWQTPSTQVPPPAVQSTQVAPPAPQVSSVEARQAPPGSQQPSGQVSGPHGRQSPLKQVRPGPHCWHGCPSRPQAEIALPSSQTTCRSASCRQQPVQVPRPHGD
jgi:hypothetical protein